MNIALLVAVLALAFLVLGALRALGVLTWRLDELEVTRPTRLGRSGLKVGRQAPEFTLPNLHGADIALRALAGRKVLLVFVQPGCGPCHEIAPELNRLHRAGEINVLVVNNAEPEEARQWAEEVHAQFPVAVQQRWAVSKKYEIFATPFAYLIDEQGLITSRGVAGSRQYLGYVLTGASRGDEQNDTESDQGSTFESEPERSHSSKEVTHA
jgi:methylamine dehydrogenase accessory protein MauD